MIPLPRTQHEGMRGRDVLGVKRALHNAGETAPAFHWLLPGFGVEETKAVKDFQSKHGLRPDGVVGPATYAKLYPYLGTYGRWLMRHAHRYVTPRQRYLNAWAYLVGHHMDILYEEIRPIPVSRIHLGPDRHIAWPLVTDCSGLTICAAYMAGINDPGGYDYNGQGNTNSILLHCQAKPESRAVAGDLVVFGPVGASLHVVTLAEDPHRFTDPEVYSHGHRGDPDDPRRTNLSLFLNYFRGQPVTYCDLLLRKG